MLPTITIDIGTTSVKLCAFDADGGLVASAREGTPTRQDAWGEIYEVDLLRGGLIAFVRGLDPSFRAGVERLAITAVGESGGLVRSDGSLASPMILWHDHRGAERLAGLTAADRSLVYRSTGLPVNANYGLSKIAWALEQAGEDAAGAQWLNIAEHLAATLTGRRWSEYSLASRTMALDLGTRTWSAEVAALLGVGVEVLPELRTAADGTPLSAGAAGETGLPPDATVHVAGHDHMVGAIGADLRSGELLNSTGTTEGLLLLRDVPELGADAERAKLANGIACTGAGSTLFASIPTGGSAFATLQSLLGIDAEELSTTIGTAHRRYLEGGVDVDALPLVLPQFRGSPPPAKDAAARGIIAGLRSDTGRDELVLGCFLGLAVQFRDVLALFPEPPERIKVIGPASRNPLWLQLKADLLGTSLSVSRFPEVVSRGAQALASGVAARWEDCDPLDVHPDPHRRALLAAWSARTAEQWQHLRGLPS
ncbi:FGGY family carbohydrate kinase [Rathayibacter sp. VKM Ac-2929]|uniref:FGGY-family carbohydrate kinase n=1 Tax=Rathayibacter sp. VKM Ac-2929 TaxID=2929480 RepID=UPI001FB27F8A|nr:FGGY family carbohydrate kinase [Rathayibacter sp. VKM Ac-2929]MCJ1672398.1 FGGY family carbohydrate kinase [Rathayibacter sp. VKM Ac-2929]